MDDYVYFLPGKYSQINSASSRLRGSEEYVLDICGNHRASPAVRKSCAQSLQQDMGRIVVHTHMGPVHAFYDFPVNSPGLYSKLGPEFEPWSGSPPGAQEMSVLFSKFQKQGIG